MKYDLHTHSNYSICSNQSVEKILERAKKKKLDGIAITDHNSIKGGIEAKKINNDENLEVIVGEEIMTDKGEVIGLFLDKEIKPGNFERVIKEIKSQNGIAIMAHPFSIGFIGRKNADEKVFSEVDAIESINARSLSKKYNIKAKKAAEKYGLAKVAGSDSHFLSEIGRATTISEDNLRKAINNKNTICSGSNRFALFFRVLSLFIIIYNKMIKRKVL